MYIIYSYLTVIWVHVMHGRMHPNYYQITILLVVDLCSSLAYFMMTQPLPIAGKLPIKTLFARQLPTNVYTLYATAYYTHSHNLICTLLFVDNRLRGSSSNSLEAMPKIALPQSPRQPGLSQRTPR